MSIEKFDDECLGCRPAMLDTKTGERLPDTHPFMVKINSLWDEQSKETKEAWHRVCCQNSKDMFDRRRVDEFLGKFTRLLNPTS